MRYILYFIIGGFTVSIATYLANSARGLLAAFVTNLPFLTLITFIVVYSESGEGAVLSYARGLILMLLPWLAYIFTVIFLTERAGFLLSLTLGVISYIIFAFLIMAIKGSLSD